MMSRVWHVARHQPERRSKTSGRPLPKVFSHKGFEPGAVVRLLYRHRFRVDQREVRIRGTADEVLGHVGAPLLGLGIQSARFDDQNLEIRSGAKNPVGQRPGRRRRTGRRRSRPSRRRARMVSHRRGRDRPDRGCCGTAPPRPRSPGGTRRPVNHGGDADYRCTGFPDRVYGLERRTARRRGVLHHQNTLTRNVGAFDKALHAMAFQGLADHERVDGAAGCVHHRARHRVGAHGQPTDGGVVPVGGELAHEPADQRAAWWCSVARRRST